MSDDWFGVLCALVLTIIALAVLLVVALVVGFALFLALPR